MAIAAINSKAADMVLMAELDRLNAHNACVCDIRGAVNRCENPQKAA
jgi:hypothetical protein